MNNKPDIKSFIITSLFNTKSYYVYENKETNQLFKEEKAFKARLIKEIILLFFPVIVSIIDLLAAKAGMTQVLDNKSTFLLLLFGFFPIILYILHALRYKRVKFVEIKSIREAEDTRIRIIEILIFLIYIGEMYEVAYLGVF